MLDYDQFHAGLREQSSASDEGGKLGLTQSSGIVYYLWTLTWGMGWVPALAALGGAVALWRAQRGAFWFVVPAPLVFIVFMGTQQRYFGRWLLPVIPLVAVAAAFATVALVDAVRTRGGLPDWARRAVLPVALLVLLGQALVYTIHNDRVLSRDDTRMVARRWMVDHVPAGTKIVVEPIVPEQWLMDPGHPIPATPIGQPLGEVPHRPHDRGCHDRREAPRRGGDLGADRGLRAHLEPAADQRVHRRRVLLGDDGLDPDGPRAGRPREGAGCDRATTARSTAAAPSCTGPRRSAGATAPVPFNFDWSFEHYPLAYDRPGPEVVIYRLHGGRCGL